MFLKISGTKIKLMSDRKMLNMIENGIRGGLSYVSTRYMKPGPQRSLVYIDQNNLMDLLKVT